MPDTAVRLGADRYVAGSELPPGTEVSLHELRTVDGATCSGVLRTVPGARTVAMLMHPRQDFTHHALVPELLAAGYAVWTQGSRTLGNDLTLLHEQTLLDMAGGQIRLRELGFDAVVNVGHSGGAGLAAFYLEQAALPPADRLQDTPGGKSVPLADADMPMPDALVLMAPHPGQGLLLERVIDPSVTDESDPMSIDPALDPYSARNGFAEAPESSSYSVDFLVVYREAQAARVRRIDAIARERIAESRAANRRYRDTGEAADRRAALAAGVLVVHRTDADLRNVDLALDPNDRPYGSLFSSRPDLSNYGVTGFGRLSTPEAWLSTWSANASRAGLERCLASVRVPTLIVELTGDQACYPADAERFLAATPASDKALVRVPGRHFGAALREGMPTGASLAGREIADWVALRFAS